MAISTTPGQLKRQPRRKGCCGHGFSGSSASAVPACTWALAVSSQVVAVHCTDAQRECGTRKSQGCLPALGLEHLLQPRVRTAHQLFQG